MQYVLFTFTIRVSIILFMSPSVNICSYLPMYEEKGKNERKIRGASISFQTFL